MDAALERLYVADAGNNRVDVFKTDGSFLFAFGWGVEDGSAELQKCTSGCLNGIAGSGSGQFSAPRTIAVDQTTHDIYVGTDSFRVQRFDEEGGFLLAFGWGVKDGSAELQSCGPEAVPASACQEGIGTGCENGACKGKCQISGGGDPLAVAPSGDIYVADSPRVGPSELGEGFNGRVQRFDSSGACVKEATIFSGKIQTLNALAIDSAEDTYLVVAQQAFKYDLSVGVDLLCTVDPGGRTGALAVGAGDHLFAAQSELESHRRFDSYPIVSEFDSACNIQRRFGYGRIERAVRGLAAFSSPEGEVFASESEKGIHYVSLDAPGPVLIGPDVSPSSTKATLFVEVNPEGKATKYHFEYVKEAVFEEDVEELGEGHGFDHAVRVPETPGEDLSAGSGFNLVTAEAVAGCQNPVEEAESGSCLTPGNPYRFRVFAENEDGEGNSPIEGPPFTTKLSPEFGESWASAVGVDTAQLHAELNPTEVPTSGYFEYVSDATYQKDVKALGAGHGFDHAVKIPDVAGAEAPIDFGAGEGFVARGVSLFPLSPGTLYHYRLVADNPLIEPVASEEHTFKTFRKAIPRLCPENEAFRDGAGALLPDCRAYELVSPLDKDNGDIIVSKEFTTSQPAVLNQSSTSGSRLAYGSYRAFGDAKASPYTSQYIAQRHAGEGWQSHVISPPRGRPIFTVSVLPQLDTEFKAFSPDLCSAWLRTLAEPPLSKAAIAGYPNIYRRQDEECGGSGYEALTTAAWPNLEGDSEKTFSLELQGLSADGSRAVFVAPDALTGSGAPLPPQERQLYVWAGGSKPKFVCVLPDGEALQGDCSAGTNLGDEKDSGKGRGASLQNAISEDGERIFWTASKREPGKIYMREHAELGKTAGECTAGKPCTIAVSAAGEALSGASGSIFFVAAANGSKAIFAAAEDLPAPLEDIEDLYEFDVESKTTRLIAHHALPGGESGILGASDDASRIYFASTDALGGQNSEGDVAVAGKPNLYLEDEGDLRFIATLADADVPATELAFGPLKRKPRLHLARVSGDGLHAAFMSSAPLTGYDNHDAAGGKADMEVFLYDAAGNGGAGKLICASCNPSGGRPAGTNTGGKGSPFWVAAQIPVPESTLYAAKVLSEDGKRLFFESTDSLIARDTNGEQDVYQWEALGKGSCDAGDATFSASAWGCIELISSGQSAKASEFIDASPGGQDVFFTTLSSLVPQDYGLVDVYDARVGGGLPSPPPPAEECEGEACQSPPAPPEAPTPSSSILGGSRQAPPAEKACPKGRGAVVRKGKRRCVASHKAKRHTQRRAKR